MKNVTLETLLKGMSPFALALLLSVNPVSAQGVDVASADDAAAMDVDSTTTEKVETKKVETKKAKAKRKHNKRGAKRKRDMSSDNNGVQEAEAEVGIVGKPGEELNVRAPGTEEVGTSAPAGRGVKRKRGMASGRDMDSNNSGVQEAEAEVGIVGKPGEELNVRAPGTEK